MKQKLTFILEQIQQAMEDQKGFCLACGYEQDCVEPDARGYECEDCERPTVYGADELLIMGKVG